MQWNRRNTIVLLHIFFWVFNVLANSYFATEKFGSMVLSSLLAAIPFYINYFLITPLFLRNNRFINILFTAAIYIPLHLTFCALPQLKFPTIFEIQSTVYVGSIWGGNLQLAFFFFAVSTASRTVLLNITKLRKKRILEEEQWLQKQEAQQFNLPLELFNNSLIKLENFSTDEIIQQEKTFERLSKILQYFTYFSNKNSIPIHQEIEQLNNLSSIKSKLENKKLNCSIAGNEEHWIPPAFVLRLLIEIMEENDTVELNIKCTERLTIFIEAEKLNSNLIENTIEKTKRQVESDFDITSKWQTNALTLTIEENW